MSVKSTQTLKRFEAMELYNQLHAKLYGSTVELTNEELGDALSELQEEKCRSEGIPCYDNYLVANDDHE